MPGLETQAPNHFVRGFQGLGIADVAGCAVIVAVHAVEHGQDCSGSAADSVELRRNLLTFSDEHELVAEDAATVDQLCVRHMAL